MTQKQLIKKLDKVMSIWVRSKDAKNGYTTCYTCGKKIDWKYECDAGHYVKRSHLSTRFDDRNVKPQCKRCNKWLDGNQEQFAIHLEKEYGHGILQELDRLKNTVKKFTQQELLDLIDKYK